MNKVYKNLIETTAGFTFNSDKPLDDRDIVKYYSDLQDYIDKGIAYEGMKVTVINDDDQNNNGYYQYTKIDPDDPTILGWEKIVDNENILFTTDVILMDGGDSEGLKININDPTIDTDTLEEEIEEEIYETLTNIQLTDGNANSF